MNCHGEDNPYLLFFLHIERYGMMRMLCNGSMSYKEISELATRHGIAPKLLWMATCRAYDRGVFRESP